MGILYIIYFLDAADIQEPFPISDMASVAHPQHIEKGEGVIASGIDVDASLDQLKKFKKTHQWVSLFASCLRYICTGVLLDAEKQC